MKPLLLPPLSLFVLALIGYGLGRRWSRLGGALVWLAAALLVGLSMPAVSGWLIQPLQIYPPLDPDRLPANAGAIVVLSADGQAGAPEYRADIVGAMTLERARYGAFLQRRTGKPVLVSGGIVQPDMTALSEQMRQVLRADFGIPVVWVEAKSRNTHENAVYSSQVLKQHGVGRVLLVTHAWHMRRAMAAFRATGIEAIPAPTRFISPPTPLPGDFLPNAGALKVSALAIHEWLGLLWYYAAGYTHSFS